MNDVVVPWCREQRLEVKNDDEACTDQADKWKPESIASVQRAALPVSAMRRDRQLRRPLRAKEVTLPSSSTLGH